MHACNTQIQITLDTKQHSSSPCTMESHLQQSREAEPYPGTPEESSPRPPLGPKQLFPPIHRFGYCVFNSKKLEQFFFKNCQACFS